MKFYAVLSTSSLSNSLTADYSVSKEKPSALTTFATGPGLSGSTREKTKWLRSGSTN